MTKQFQSKKKHKNKIKENTLLIPYTLYIVCGLSLKNLYDKTISKQKKHKNKIKENTLLIPYTLYIVCGLSLKNLYIYIYIYIYIYNKLIPKLLR